MKISQIFNKNFSKEFFKLPQKLHFCNLFYDNNNLDFVIFWFNFKEKNIPILRNEIKI